MFDESELITHDNGLYTFAEVLALKSVREIQMPVCNFLTQLTSTDCLKLMKHEMNKWSDRNESMERILLFYLVTDYIGCGLSSPGYHAVFHKNLNTETSKIKLLNDLLKIWDSLFKNYKISNIDFIKKIIVCLERLFIKMSILVPDNHVKFKCNKVIDKINYCIKEYEQNILDDDTSSDDDMQQQLNCNMKKVIGIENIVPKTTVQSKENCSIKNLVQTNKRKSEVLDKSSECMILNDKQQKLNMDLQKHNSKSLIDHHLLKKPKIMSSSMLNRSATSDIDCSVTVPHEQVNLNAFQIMMLNAKKQKKTKLN
ncbi:uncharacterized protein LOC111029357 [Myzus persicae]|uniref:uncharacterized protein LOC111029357 n=1 Tax=Myzus persicae TaxID=13164 RepID=UPI000B933D1B|nr:uncharacterized protein LOC111029357 [Myzus persicae]